MLELFRKAVLMSVGAATLTEERIRSLAEELIAQGKLSKEEGEKMVKETLAKAEDSRKEWEAKVKDLVQDGFRKVDLVPRADFDALLKRVDALEERLKALEPKEG